MKPGIDAWPTGHPMIWDEFVVMWAFLGLLTRYPFAFANTDWCL